MLLVQGMLGYLQLYFRRTSKLVPAETKS